MALFQLIRPWRSFYRLARHNLISSPPSNSGRTGNWLERKTARYTVSFGIKSSDSALETSFDASLATELGSRVFLDLVRHWHGLSDYAFLVSIKNDIFPLFIVERKVSRNAGECP